MLSRLLPSRSLLSLTGLMCLVAVLLGCSPANAQGPLQVELERVFPNVSLQRMVLLTHAGDGSGRVFVVQQPGVIQVFPNDQTATPALFLDIREQVNDSGNEEGLLGLAFDPEFVDNGQFYVYYTASGPRRSVLSRFTVGADPNRADPDSELVLLEVPQPYANHNGGMLAFGPDAYLYVSLGDGGSGGDPHGHGQNTETLLGSILRIDVRGATPEAPYAVPPDNPFVNQNGGSRPEMWAYGLRNPWRFSFDPRTGDLWVADVGQNRIEEINLVTRGGNYGWNVMEGTECFESDNCDPSQFVAPIAEYRIPENGCAVVGGYVYHSRSAPLLEGAYLYADYCSGRVWALFREGEGFAEPVEILRADFQVPSFGLDEEGEVYLLGFDGSLYRFVSPEPQPQPATTASPDPAEPATTTPPPPVPGQTATPTATPTPTVLNGPNGPVSTLPALFGAIIAIGVVAGGILLLARRGR